MKSKFAIAAFLIAAFVGGFLAGQNWTAKSWNSFLEDYTYLRESNEAHHMVRALTYLREGKQQEGMDTLEMWLDSAVLTYTPLILSPTPKGPNEHVLRAIRVARDYRAKHPWKSEFTSPAVSKALEQVMAIPK